MKRNLITVLAIAILGVLGYYAKTHNSMPTTSAQPSSSMTSGSSSTNQGMYKNGTYTGITASSPYGDIQVAAVITGGKITDIEFLKMPNDHPHSIEVTNMSEPLLKQSTLVKQNAKDIDMVSGATSNYYAYQESLQAALDKAVQS